MTRYALHHGDCLLWLATLDADSVDSVVCDPPYHLQSISKRFKPGAAPVKTHGKEDAVWGRKAVGFMGTTWDGGDIAFRPETWAAVLRVLKPGGHLLAFGGTRTYHRIACAIEDAGFEVRDMLEWLYGSGFPKSLDVSKAMEKAAGLADGAADAIGFAEGLGTAIKPSHEPICLARKPLAESSIVRQVLATGTGGLNIDGCRVGTDVTTTIRSGHSGDHGKFGNDGRTGEWENPPGRYPPNTILSHSVTEDGNDACADGCVEGCAVRELDLQSGPGRGSHGGGTRTTALGLLNDDGWVPTPTPHGPASMGSASSFFPCFRYQAKPSRAEREMGCDDLEPGTFNRTNPGGLENDPRWAPQQRRNTHATVKSIALMRWLCRLVTPPGGIVLDPFTGSGTTGMAALWEGFRFTGCELLPVEPDDPDHFAIAEARIRYAANNPPPEEQAAKVEPLTEGQGTLWGGEEDP